jgi:hypothetical protein
MDDQINNRNDTNVLSYISYQSRSDGWRYETQDRAHRSNNAAVISFLNRVPYPCFINYPLASHSVASSYRNLH